jgi:hypothetical protein
MSSKAGYRNIQRIKLKETKRGVISELRLLKNHSDKYFTIQIRKLLLIGDSGKMMTVDEFKHILGEYLVLGKIPDMPEVIE